MLKKQIPVSSFCLKYRIIFRSSKTVSQNEQKKMLFNNKKQEPELKFNLRLPVAFKRVGHEDLIFPERFLRNMPYHL